MQPWIAGVLLATGLAAQDAVPPSNALITVLRGEFLEREGNPQSGEFLVRMADHKVERCLYDAQTYVERVQQKSDLSALTAGEPVEVIADRNGRAGRCYARAVRVVADQVARRAITRLPVVPPGRLNRVPLSPLGDLFPRGNLTFAGIVRRVSPELLVVQTRADGPKSLVLRPDTRYLSGGSAVSLSSLQINTRVFIRAGKNFDDELEAYQIVWGDILQP